MKARIVALMVALVLCLGLPWACAAGTGPSEELEKAWRALGDRPSFVPKTLMLGRRGVAALLSSKLFQRQPDAKPFDHRRNFIRARAVLAASREKGCLWLLAQTRYRTPREIGLLLRASRDCGSYAELIQFLVTELTNATEALPPGGWAERPDLAYDWRICDLAYNQLLRRLTGLPKTPFVGRPLKDTVAYPRRDQQIKALYTWIQTDTGKKAIIGLPSALAAVSKTKAMPVEARLVRLMLGRMKPRVVNLPDVASHVALLEVVENELLPWSKREKAVQQKLLSDAYSAKDIVVRLPQGTMRQRGYVEWVLLKRQDRVQIAKALRQLIPDKGEQAHVKNSIIEIAGELLRTWGKDDEAATQELTALLKEMSESEPESWMVRARAQQALKPETGKGDD